MTIDSRDNPLLRSRYLVSSLVVHLLVILFSISAPQWLAETFPSLFRFSKAQDLFSAQSFIQVDVLGLPDKLSKDLEKIDLKLRMAEKEEAPVVAEEEENSDLIDEVDIARKKALEALKVSSDKKAKLDHIKSEALKKLEQEAERQRILDGLKTKSKEGARGALAGNMLSKGASTTGSVGNAKDQWTENIRNAVLSNLHPYPWHKGKKLSVEITMIVLVSGIIKTFEISKKSGVPSFDSLAVQAIQLSQPLPIPLDLTFLREPVIVTLSPDEAK